MIRFSGRLQIVGVMQVTFLVNQNSVYVRHSIDQCEAGFPAHDKYAGRQGIGGGRVGSDDGDTLQFAGRVPGTWVDDVMVADAVLFKKTLVVAGCRYGGGGAFMSAMMLYHWVGISDSSSITLV